METAEGTTPAEITATADPRGLAAGSYTARITIEIAGWEQAVTLTLSVGPRVAISPLGIIEVPYGQPFTHKFTIASSSTPIDFTLQPYDSWLKISPESGRTPLEVTVSFDRPGFVGASQIFVGQIVMRAGERMWIITQSYRAVPAIRGYFPDMLDPEASAGSLIVFRAGTSRCEPAAAGAGPWPMKLGSCTLRTNGKPMPVCSISIAPISVNPSVEPFHNILAQLPYDLEGSTATVEIEDMNGRKSALPLRIKPVKPVFASIAGAILFQPFVRRTGEEILVKVSGLGATDSAAPWGDVPADTVRPVAPIEASIGGRAARVLSAELSRTGVGYFEVRIEVPAIAPDLHGFDLRVAGIDVPLGSIVVTR